RRDSGRGMMPLMPANLQRTTWAKDLTGRHLGSGYPRRIGIHSSFRGHAYPFTRRGESSLRKKFSGMDANMIHSNRQCVSDLNSIRDLQNVVPLGTD
ncbi:MAG: hypothetical protein QXP27_06915, partial [Candidatus Methanomethyliaceae archaeon]